MIAKSSSAQPPPRKPAMPPSSNRAILGPLENPDKRDAVMDAISSVEITSTKAWDDLDSLSSRTHVDEIEAIPEGIFETEQNGFRAAATIYVTLTYDKGSDEFATTGSFPAEAQGHFEADGQAIIDSLTVDTASFYE